MNDPYIINGKLSISEDKTSLGNTNIELLKNGEIGEIGIQKLVDALKTTIQSNNDNKEKIEELYGGSIYKYKVVKYHDKIELKN
jgi:hypothetical protein